MIVYQFALTGPGALLVGLTRWSTEPLYNGDPDWHPTGISYTLPANEHLDAGGQIRRSNDSVKQDR